MFSITLLNNKVYNNTLLNATEGIEESEDSLDSNAISNNKIEQIG